jgi:hypothetical protein
VTSRCRDGGLGGGSEGGLGSSIKRDGLSNGEEAGETADRGLCGSGCGGLSKGGANGDPVTVGLCCSTTAASAATSTPSASPGPCSLLIRLNPSTTPSTNSFSNNVICASPNKPSVRFSYILLKISTTLRRETRATVGDVRDTRRFRRIWVNVVWERSAGIDCG